MQEQIKIATTELLKIYHNLGITRRQDPNCYCHNFFASRDLDDTDTPQYTWQWNLNLAEYNDIQTTLCKNAVVLSDVISHNKICCKLLQIYVSEWYKRDYNGNDNQGNAFDSINADNLQEKVCRLLDIDEDVVYRDSSNRCRWIDTIYVDGGLPLNYLLKNNNTAFRRTIGNIIESYAEDTDYSFAELGDICNNQVVNMSYRAKTLYPNEDASIFDFIQEVIINENVKIEGFEEFNTLVRELNRKALKQKFELRYRVYKTAKNFQLIPQLYLKKEANDIQYAISQKRLTEWGVHPENDRFLLSIEAQREIIFRKQFDKCLRGDYITFPKKDRFDLRIDHELCFKKWNVWIDEKMIDEKTAITNNLWKKGYVQMYSDDEFSWYSRPDKQYKYAAVMFDKTRDNNLNSSDDTSIFIDGKPSNYIGWKPFKETISFQIDGKEIKLFNKAGDIFVEYNNKPQLLKYYTDDEYKLVICDERPSFNIVFTKNESGEVDRVVKEDDCLWKYRYGEDDDWKNMDDSCIINRLGYVEIELKLKSNSKAKTVKCFSIPKDLDIRNVSEGNSRRTDFVNFKSLEVFYDGKKLVNDNGTIRKFWGNISEYDYHHPIAFYQITDGLVRLNVTCNKPIDATIVEKKNGSVVDVGRRDQKLRLPIITLDRVTIRQLPNDRIIEFDKNRYRLQTFNALTNHQYTDSYQLRNTYINFQTFTHSFTLGQNIGNIDLSGLHFVFVPTNNPKQYVDVSLDPNDRNRLGIDTNDEGIIIQCTSKYEIPLFLLKPIYVPPITGNRNLTEQQRRIERIHRINRYNQNLSKDTSTFNEALSYFEVATVTGMYFGVFDALLGLVCNYADKNQTTLGMSESAANNLALFYKKYIEQGGNVNYPALWRMADEFLFDWNLIPQYLWLKLFEDLSPVTALLKHRSYHLDFFTIKLRENVNIKEDNQNIILRTITNSFGRGRNSEEKSSFWHLTPDSRVRVLNTLVEIEKSSISKYIETEK